MRTVVRALQNRLEFVPWAAEWGRKVAHLAQIPPFQRLGHLTAHPRAHLQEAAPGRHPHAVRLAGHRPDRVLQVQPFVRWTLGNFFPLG